MHGATSATTCAGGRGVWRAVESAVWGWELAVRTTAKRDQLATDFHAATAENPAGPCMKDIKQLFYMMIMTCAFLDAADQR
jgi:hypothetical protein